MYFGVFVGVMVIFKYAKLGQSEKTFLIVAVILLAIITGCYYAWKAGPKGNRTSSSAAKFRNIVPSHRGT